MYQKIVVEGVVLQKRAVGEANIVALLMTAELGLVRVAARSARLEKSKLRYGLEVFTTGRFCLLRGAHEWRLTGIEHMSRALVGSTVPPARRKALGRIARLLVRLIPGQEPSAELFTIAKEGFESLSRAVEQEVADAIECVLVLKLLSVLGYLPHTPELAPFLNKQFFDMELSAEVTRSRKVLIKAINESLQASGL